MDKKTNEKLIDAAALLFSEYGYDRVSIRQIAAAANVNSALISYYFKNKAGLYKAVLERQFDFATSFAQQMKLQQVSPKEVLMQYARLMAKMHQQSPTFVKMMVHELIQPSPFILEIVRYKLSPVFSFLSETVAKAASEGSFRGDIKAEQAVLMLIGIVNFFFIARPLSQNLIDRVDKTTESYIEQSLAIFLNGIERGC